MSDTVFTDSQLESLRSEGKRNAFLANIECDPWKNFLSSEEPEWHASLLSRPLPLEML